LTGLQRSRSLPLFYRHPTSRRAGVKFLSRNVDFSASFFFTFSRWGDAPAYSGGVQSRQSNCFSRLAAPLAHANVPATRRRIANDNLSFQQHAVIFSWRRSRISAVANMALVYHRRCDDGPCAEEFSPCRLRRQFLALAHAKIPRRGRGAALRLPAAA
jgi:hypothetical protein